MTKLKGKTVIVTGGGGGIGGATCRRFAAEGAKVAVFDMNMDAAQKVAAEINAAGGTVETSSKGNLGVHGEVNAQNWVLDPQTLTVVEDLPTSGNDVNVNYFVEASYDPSIKHVCTLSVRRSTISKHFIHSSTL